MRHAGRNYGDRTGTDGGGHFAKSNRAGAREEAVRLVAAVVNVRQPLGDLHNMDVRNSALATGHHPLHVPERAFDGLDILPLANERLLGRGTGHGWPSVCSVAKFIGHRLCRQ
jgi:hypothetical protein